MGLFDLVLIKIILGQSLHILGIKEHLCKILSVTAVIKQISKVQGALVHSLAILKLSGLIKIY